METINEIRLRLADISCILILSFQLDYENHPQYTPDCEELLLWIDSVSNLNNNILFNANQQRNIIQQHALRVALNMEEMLFELIKSENYSPLEEFISIKPEFS